MDALELLRSDHDKVRDLFEQFKSAQEAGDTATMAQLKEQIFSELQVHTAIEEEIFYPAAEDVGEEAEELVHEGVEEHHLIDVLMEEIEQLEPSDEAWTAKMTVLIENVEHHAGEEEEELFPQLRETFGDDKLAALGKQLQQAKDRKSGAAGASGKADTSGMSKEELYEQAKEQDVEGRSQMTKDQLSEAVDQEK